MRKYTNKTLRLRYRKHLLLQLMPLIAYILGRHDLLGHDIGQVTARANSTCRTMLFATSWIIRGWWLQRKTPLYPLQNTHLCAAILRPFGPGAKILTRKICICMTAYNKQYSGYLNIFVLVFVTVVSRLSPNIPKNCAFCDTSTKFGTNVH